MLLPLPLHNHIAVLTPTVIVDKKISQVVPQLIKLIPTLSAEPEALTEVLHALGNFAEVADGRFKESIGSLPATFER